jgi:tryptophan-rich sensory protein
MGYASYRVWKAGNGFKGEAKVPLIFYSIQLILNWIWTPVFFGLEALLAAFVEIVFVWIFVIATAILFFRVDKIAGVILVPYIGWVTFASILNFSLWQLNK